MTNIITAAVGIINAYKNKKVFSTNKGAYGTSINNWGAYLEDFIAAAFSGSLLINDIKKRQELKEKAFCYSGSQNLPPDLMLRNGGPAIEVKKHASDTGGLSLNSSPPRQTLRKEDKRIASAARTAEYWEERKIIYAIGTIPGSNNIIKSIQLVYGDCFAASHEFYDKVEGIIREQLEGAGSESPVEKYEGNELGRMNAVDPLKATYLRVRGMWEIKNPLRIFKEEGIADYSLSKGFTLLAMAKKAEFGKLSKESPEALAKLKTYADIKDIKIINPDNTAQRL
ncbi:MAG: Type II site-specific deoxyribonuclease, partial [Candidatus Parvarchaeum acidiphilum ARMAN-4_'5-way FS']